LAVVQGLKRHKVMLSPVFLFKDKIIKWYCIFSMFFSGVSIKIQNVQIEDNKIKIGTPVYLDKQVVATQLKPMCEFTLLKDNLMVTT